MSLFKRRIEEVAPPPPAPLVRKPSWSGRLGGIGDAIDELPHELRGIAVITVGSPADTGAVVHGIGFHEGTYHAVWAPTMYRVELDAEALIQPAEVELTSGQISPMADRKSVV